MPHTHVRSRSLPPIPKPSPPCPPNICGPDEEDEDTEDDEPTLASMTVTELRRLASMRGVTVPKGSTKMGLVALLSEV